MPVAYPSQPLTAAFANDTSNVSAPSSGAPLTSKTSPFPSASQIGTTPGAASLADGWVPLNATALSGGGIPPWIMDMNGVDNLFSSNLLPLVAGQLFEYNSAFSSTIGGYALGALLLKADGSGYWQNTTVDNTSDPDTSGSGWTSLVDAMQLTAAFTAFLAANNTFTGINDVPTAASGTSTEQIASTQFVQEAMTGIVGGIVAGFNSASVTLGTGAVTVVGGGSGADAPIPVVSGGLYRAELTTQLLCGANILLSSVLVPNTGAVSEIDNGTGFYNDENGSVRGIAGNIAAASPFSTSEGTFGTPAPNNIYATSIFSVSGGASSITQTLALSGGSGSATNTALILTRLA